MLLKRAKFLISFDMMLNLKLHFILLKQLQSRYAKHYIRAFSIWAARDVPEFKRDVVIVGPLVE